MQFPTIGKDRPELVVVNVRQNCYEISDSNATTRRFEASTCAGVAGRFRRGFEQPSCFFSLIADCYLAQLLMDIVTGSANNYSEVIYYDIIPYNDGWKCSQLSERQPSSTGLFLLCGDSAFQARPSRHGRFATRSCYF